MPPRIKKPAGAELTGSEWETLHRILAQTSTIAYIRRLMPWFRVEEVHCLIATHFDALLDREIDRLMTFLPPRTGKPVDESQLVMRGDGVRVPLREISAGDQVFTDKGRARTVTSIHILGDLPTVEIITKGGRRLIAALDHPVLTARGWINAGHLRADDVLGTPNGCESVSDDARLHEFRLAGYFIGDGNTTINQGLLASNITCHDPAQADDIRACVAAMGFTIGKSKLVTRLSVGGGCRDWLRRIGMAGVKSIHKRVPGFVFMGSNAEIANFIGAYFACDGSIFRKSQGRTGRSIEFGSANHGLLEDVQHLLMRLGVASNVSRRIGKDQLGRPYPSSRLTLGSENEVAKFAARIPVYGVKAARLGEARPISAFPAQYLSDPIAAITDGGTRPCRCLTVAEDETFLAGDLIVHNSTMGSVVLPSMWAGRYPTDKILQVGHSVELSRNFSLDVRGLMMDDEYQWIFPGVRLVRQARAAGKWRIEDVYATEGTYSAMDAVEKGLERERLKAGKPRRSRAQQGQYNAAGVTSNIAGKGFHLGIADDLMSEQDKDSKITKDRIWNWWGPGFYTRRQPERNAILMMATRWSKDDPPGRLIDQMQNTRDRGAADDWVILNVPAILDGDTAKRIYLCAKEYGQVEDIQELKANDSFSPRRWSLKEIERTRANMTERDFQALMMGSPTESEGHILKKKHWRLWPFNALPECFEIFQMYDTAFDENTKNDFSARTTWGLFEHAEVQGERKTVNMILLDAWKKRVDAPLLKKYVMVSAFGGKEAARALKQLSPRDPEMWEDIDLDEPAMHPDRIMVENKSSGNWLIKELRRIRVPRPLPVAPWNLPRGGKGKEMSKYARAALGSLVLEQGAVWYPQRKWAEAVVTECAECHFDGSDESDDLPDTVTASMIYVRQTHRVELRSDIDEEAERQPRSKVTRQFYGARHN